MKPSGYWNNINNCIEEAKKYNTRTDFKNYAGRAYRSCSVNGILDIACSHMVNKVKKWTFESAKIEAKKYDSRKNFKKLNAACYNFCIKHKIIDIVCEHMISKIQKWTLELAKIEAKKYSSRGNFEKGNLSCYSYCIRNRLLDIVCEHMVSKQKWTLELAKIEAEKYDKRHSFEKGNLSCYSYCVRNSLLDIVCENYIEHRKPRDYWTLERCQEESLKYKTKKDFRNNNTQAYNKAIRKGWLNQICEHMEIRGTRYLRFIYVFEFKNNHVYVGLTYNSKERYNSHLNKYNSPVYKHIEKTNSEFEFKVITEKPISNEDAQILEHETIQKYRELGWNILNKRKTGKNIGSLGAGIRKWTFENCQKEALKYQHKRHFEKGNASAYNAAKHNGWFEEICGHMTEIRKPNRYWNKERCKEAALKYENKSSFKKNNNVAYHTALRNLWLEEICSHMTNIRKDKTYWTLEICIQEAAKYTSKYKFQKTHIYKIARKNGWLDKIYEIFEVKQKPRGYWSFERCRDEAFKYQHRSDFKKNCVSGYNSARFNSWLNQICSHMIPK
jgi:predicted GIY-YIG superfamily endonuclease